MANNHIINNPLRIGKAASDPSGIDGLIYFNTTTNKFRSYASGAWSDFTTGSIALTGQSLSQYNVIVGNSSNLSVAVNSNSAGDILVDETNGLTIKSGAIVNVDINASAAIDFSKLAALASGNILVGNGSNVAASVIMTGEATIDNTGAITLSNSAIIAKLLTGYTPVAGVVAATDTILQAIQKIDANDSLKLPLAGGTMSGNIAMGSTYKLTGLAAGTTAGDSVRYEQAILVTGANAFTADQSLGSNKLTNLSDPASAQDAATKAYVDSLLEGLNWKNTVRVATDGSNITLSGTQTIDGVSLIVDDRVLVKDQSAPANNGIYLVKSGAWVRTNDANSWLELQQAAILVREGTVNTNSRWQCNISAGGTIGVTSITFIQFAGTGDVTGTGTSNYVAYWTGAGTLGSEQYLAQSRGGFGANVSAFSGIVKVAAGTFSASAIVNADIDAAAAIAYSKLNLSSSIVNADIASAAAIALNKLATVTANRVLLSDASGFVSASSVSNTTLSYLDATSSIQTQLNAKASTALDNLASVAINTSLISDTDNTDDLGSSTLNWKDVWTKAVKSGTGIILSANDGSHNVSITAAKLRLSADGTNFAEQLYSDSAALAGSTPTPTPIGGVYTYVAANFEGIIVTYKIKQATSNEVRTGQFYVANKGTTSVSLSDNFTETADLGIILSAVVNGSNIEVNFINESANASTIRSSMQFIRA